MAHSRRTMGGFMFADRDLELDVFIVTPLGYVTNNSLQTPSVAIVPLQELVGRVVVGDFHVRPVPGELLTGRKATLPSMQTSLNRPP